MQSTHDPRAQTTLTEKRLRESDERYRAFIANSSEGIWRYELEDPLDLAVPEAAQIEHLYRHARLAELNDAMARMYGYERAAELIGVSVEAMLPPGDPTSHAYLAQLVKARFHVRAIESMERDREGRARYFENSMVPIIENGKLMRAWGMRRDITKRKHAEETLREADRRKDEFLATLAHELRNPLAPLKNGLQIARLTTKVDSPLHRTIEMMDRQLNHLVHLVNDLLDVARISSGKVILRRERVLMSEVLGHGVEASRALIEARNHRLIVDRGTQDPCVEGDFDRLAQVFANLLSNAAKYSESGGEIRVSLARENGEVVVRVADTGIGIPEEDLSHVFDLFSQVRAHQGRAEGGLGIGLSLVKSLVGLHGGSISVESAGPGRGSCFTVRLPACEDEVTCEAQSDSGGEHVSARPRRILIADDNRDAATSLATLLEIAGHEVVIAHDGLDAVEKAQTFDPDIALLDLGMPRLGGIEAARRLRTLPGGRALHIVALTGWGQEVDRRRTSAAGFDAHFVKPVDHETLRQLIEDARQGPGGV